MKELVLRVLSPSFYHLLGLPLIWWLGFLSYRRPILHYGAAFYLVVVLIVGLFLCRLLATDPSMAPVTGEWAVSIMLLAIFWVAYCAVLGIAYSWGRHRAARGYNFPDHWRDN